MVAVQYSCCFQWRKACQLAAFLDDIVVMLFRAESLVFKGMFFIDINLSNFVKTVGEEMDGVALKEIFLST